MTVPVALRPGLRRRSEQLDRALHGPDGGADGGQRRELALVARLRDTGQALAPVLSADIRAAQRQRLVAVATVQIATGAVSAGAPRAAAAPVPAAAAAPAAWRQRAAMVTAGTMASVVAVSGVAVASSRSLPGDPFYGVKRITEDVQLRLADGSQAEGERHLQFAAARMREVRALTLGRDGEGLDRALSTDEAERVEQALADMDADTRDGVRLLTESFRETQRTEPLDVLARFAEEQRSGLEPVLAVLPAEGRARVQESLGLVSDVETRADELLMLLDCTAACDPSSSAPVLPPGAVPGGNVPGSAGSGDAPCGCPTPAPRPEVAPAPSGPSSPSDGPSGGPGAPPSGSSSPPPSSGPSPGPSPSPSPSGPLPPLPPLPPAPTLPPLDPLDPLTEPLTDPLDTDTGPLAPLTDPLTDPLLGDGGLLSGLSGVAPLVLVGPTAPASLAVRALLSWSPSSWWGRP